MPTPITPSVESELQLLQNDIGYKLQTESYFADIPVFVVRKVTIAEAITKAVMGTSYQNGKTGLAVQVMMPSVLCVDQYEKVPGPFFIASYIVRVQEFPDVNMGAKGTGKPAEEVALNILNMLHLYSFGRSIVGFRASPNAIVGTEDFLPRLTYDCEFHAVCQLPDAQNFRVPEPTATIDGSNNLTLACADTQASIYWCNQDTSYPSSQFGGTLYTAPFPVIVGQTIRACAYRAGYQSSTIMLCTIDP